MATGWRLAGAKSTTGLLEKVHALPIYIYMDMIYIYMDNLYMYGYIITQMRNNGISICMDI